MSNFFHRLLNPHCVDCKDNDPVEVLCEQLQFLRNENDRLLEVIVNFNKPIFKEQEVPARSEEPKEIRTQTLPWRVRQQMLEQEDARKAEVLRSLDDNKGSISIEELEKEMDIVHAN